MRLNIAPLSLTLAGFVVAAPPAAAFAETSFHLRAQVQARCWIVETRIEPVQRKDLTVLVNCNAALYRLNFVTSDRNRVVSSVSTDGDFSVGGDSINLHPHRPGLQRVRFEFAEPLSQDAVTALELTTF